ncbi:hypothetical protein HCJ72_00595 [Listeria welshimeri]|nr:hypothetical protein [Listeria welshimeri]
MDKHDLFIEAFLDFDLTVRSNEGFNKIKYEKVVLSLKGLEPMFKKDKSVPLKIANLFIDLYPALESSAERHEEETRKKILDAADELSTIVREITS